MVNRKRKYESGAAVAFISRGKALKKLQLSLSDFRKLCILKGIYPQEPRHPKVANKGSTAAITFYLLKDIQFLLHEPIVHKMRDYKIFVRKLKKAVEKKDPTRAKGLRKNKPRMTLDHIVKERYPSLLDALRDLDDALSLCFLFSKMPKNKKVSHELTRLCKRLVVEFMNYIIATRALRKVFISIKGFYFQVNIQGQAITWLMPHNVAYTHPVDVDYRILSTFSEFSCVLLGFINYGLYQSIELSYPPAISIEEYDDTDEVCSSKDVITEVLAAMTTDLKQFDYDATVDCFEAVEGQKKDDTPVDLFKDLKFFINREVNREIFTFVIRSFGGEVSWDKTVYPLGCTFDAEDPDVTHQVVDKSFIADKKFSRSYVQPQWIVDCVNAKQLLPVKDYTIGSILPPHLSPFVEEQEGDYVPPEKIRLNRLMGNEEGDNEEEEETSEVDTKKAKVVEQITAAKKRKPMDKTEKATKEGKVQRFNTPHKQEEERNEERKLAEMAIPKKHKRLYGKIKHLNKMKKQEALALSNKRKMIDSKQTKAKKS